MRYWCLVGVDSCTWPVHLTCVRCVWWERTRYGVARDARESGFMRSLCLVGADSVWRGL